MSQGSIIQQKSYAFSVRIIRVYQHLAQEKREFILSKQLLRSATSIGANVEEGLGGQSERDFFAKLNIAYKEARETLYWLRLLHETDYLTTEIAEPLIQDCEEILRISGSIIRTTREKLKKKQS
jgi:four helix bundle protein